MPRAKKVETEESVEVKQEVKKESVAPKRVIDSNTPVEVMNNTTGTLVFVNNRTQAKWTLRGYGAIDEMLVSDLKNMRSSSPGLILDGYLVILDDDVVEHMRLQKVYENILTEDQVDYFFKQNDVTMRDILNKSPKGMKELLFDKAKEKIRNNDTDMDYNSKKRVFEEVFNTKLDDLS